MSVVIGNNLSERIVTGDQNDSIFGLDGNDIINSGGGNDVVFGGNGNDFLFGESGDDVLKGGVGNDLLFGGEGSDQLFGGAGADTMTGGAGSDLFAFNFADAGLVDEITDFSVGEDTILIQGVGACASVDYDSDTGIVFVNGQAFIQLDAGLSVDNDDFLIT
jgi:Ca2+-binding RTX toxin-like protein